MKHFPNILTALRILFSVILFFQHPFSVLFYIFYSLCGISDMADGFAARKLKAESAFGATLDSIADFIFFVVTAIVVFPYLTLKKNILIIILTIFIIRIIGILLGFILQKKLILLHTVADKITGLLLFVSVYFIGKIDINILAVPICVAASVAAIQEVALIIKEKER